jgi:hypothetical protein
MLKLKTIGCLALAVAAAGCLAPQAKADTIAEEMNRAMFAQSGDFYRNTGIDRQATLLLGLSYPDLEAVGDARSVDRIYQEGIRQRASDPVRTTDLPNPFNTSILANPRQLGSKN